jgi:2-dehydropantoate 2-reductase
MRILVIGAGAVGGYFGGYLAHHGRDVTFLVRGARAEQLRTIGLQISAPDSGEITVPNPQLITSEELPKTKPFDLILVSTKAYSLEAAMNDFTPAVGPDTAILPLLNGMKHLDVLVARFGEKPVLGGVARIVSDIDAQGRIVLGEPLHEIVFGERDKSQTPRTQAILATLTNPTFKTTLSPDVLADMWSKWTLLSTMGIIGVLARGTVGQVAQVPGGPDFVRDILSEASDISAANGYPQDAKFLDGVHKRFTDPNSALTSSMYRDLIKGAPVEADHILGDLIARGQPHGITPHLIRAAYVQLSVYSASRKP